MLDLPAQIAAIIGSSPQDLSEYYYKSDFPRYPTSRINCLSFDEAREYTRKFQEISVCKKMGLWILDDANDSNPFGYISKGPCTGMIIHFSHDPEPEIAYSTLAQFLKVMHDSGAQGLDIDEIAKEHITIDLSQPIRELVREETDDASFFLTTYLPISGPLEMETIRSLSSHNDFFVREATAIFLANFPFEDGLSSAELLASDKHPQVARAGKAAIASIKKKKYIG